MSSCYKKPSGSQRRTEQKRKATSEKELLKKVPKLDAWLTASSTGDPTPGSSTTEEQSLQISAAEPEHEESALVGVVETENLEHDSDVEAGEQGGKYSTDPNEWDPDDDEFIEYLAKLGFPERNIKLKFPETKKEYPDSSSRKPLDI